MNPPIGPIATLRKEHDAIVRMLDVTEAVARKISRGEDVNPAILSDLEEFFHTFADECHHGKEEALLFPTLEKKGLPRYGGPLGVMLMEHDEGRSLIRKMKDAARTLAFAPGDRKAGEAWAEAACNYAALLRQHIFKENNVLFAMAERMLSETEQSQLAQEFEKVEEQKMGPGTHERMHALVDRLTEMVLPKAS